MQRILLSLPFLLLAVLFASPALSDNRGEDGGSIAAVPSMEGIGVWLLVISLLGATAWGLRRRSTRAGLTLVLLPLVPLLIAPHYSNWHGFTNGQVADADEVNHNFVLAAAALDDFEVRVSALEAATQVQAIADEVGAFVSLAHGVTMIKRAACDEQTVWMPVTGAYSGQIKHIIYDVACGPGGQNAVTIVQFQDLRVGDGLASALKFNYPGQSVTLIYLDNAWRLTNSGALVVP